MAEIGHANGEFISFANNFVFAIDTTTQTVSVANTFQALNYDTNQKINSWTHTPGTNTFGCNRTGRYLLVVAAHVEKSGGGAEQCGVRALFNGVEIPSSYDGVDITATADSEKIFIFTEFDGTTGQNLTMEFVGTDTTVQILPPPNPGGATLVPSTRMFIRRLR